jgi:hypothetical protein
VIELEELTLKAASFDPNLTALTPTSRVPVIATVGPPDAGPFFGESL